MPAVRANQIMPVAERMTGCDAGAIEGRDQTGWDPKRNIFHWDHVTPVADITDAILALKPATEAEIERELARSM